jgi:hypothetical protein
VPVPVAVCAACACAFTPGGSLGELGHFPTSLTTELCVVFLQVVKEILACASKSWGVQPPPYFPLPSVGAMGGRVPVRRRCWCSVLGEVDSVGRIAVAVWPRHEAGAVWMWMCVCVCVRGVRDENEWVGHTDTCK